MSSSIFIVVFPSLPSTLLRQTLIVSLGLETSEENDPFERGLTQTETGNGEVTR